MTDYLPSFIVEPVLRQARRLSRLSSNEESQGFLPAVPDLRTWYPTRLWSTSPPPSITEDDTQHASAFQQIARNIQLWTNQIPSPPLEPMDDSRQEEDVPIPSNNASVSEFSALDPALGQQARPVRLEEARTASETSLNPLLELPHRSRVHEDGSRGHSQSDPASGTRSGNQIIANISAALPQSDDEYRRLDGSGTLPEDDGMGPLRQRISAIWAGEGTQAEKSRLVHTLMMARYQLTQARGSSTPGLHGGQNTFAEISGTPMDVVSGASQEVVFNLTPSDLVPTHAPLDLEDLPDEGEEGHGEVQKPDLGCMHYKRNVKLQCTDCERWYTCRMCHDDVENHALPRTQTKHMLCMLCNTPQPASQFCRMCGELAASYYCSVCKLWNNDPRKSIYHCDDCGICRLGQGIGKDFFHCKKCAACMSIKAEETHKCIEKSTMSDCPICGDYLFTSSKSVAFMNCGHSIHELCFAEWCQSSYKCPICSKSITNMESQFRRLDRHIAEQPMPEEYRDTRAYIFCNDCSSRSTTKFHWLGLKCERCESYNTAQLELLGPHGSSQSQQNQADTALSTTEQHDNSANQAVAGSITPVQTDVPVPSPATFRPHLIAHSPPARSARSISPIVGSYFSTDRREDRPRLGTPMEDRPRLGTPMEDRPRLGTPMEDDENLDFWGASSPPTQPDEHDKDAVESDDSEESSGDVMEDDDGEEDEVDTLDIFGHR